MPSAPPSDTGATLTALAALLTAFTGMISAVVAGVVTLRRRRNGNGQAAAVAVEVARLLAEQEKRDRA